MASQHGSPFTNPIIGQNFGQSSFNVNTRMDRPSGTPFQMPSNPPCGSFQAPERFIHGFPNRPQFPNFPGACNFLNRPPPAPPLSSTPSAPPIIPPGNSFLSPNNYTPFLSQSTSPIHHAISARPLPPPPSPLPPPPSPLPHHSPDTSQPPPPLSCPPFSPQRLFSPPSQPSQQNQFPPMPLSPQQHQRFRVNSPSPAPVLRFESSFQRPYRPWNQTTRFSGPRTPFSNRSPNVVKPFQSKDSSQQVYKKKKQKSREFRKLKDDSTEKPFSCDTCDRAFVTEDELKEHISQHIKCDYKNCTFEAHPKIVMLHKKMQHETGYADRINKLKDDAEVKKWREERRKRFPTAENIKKRQAEQAEKIARGEVLETKDFGKFKRRREETQNLANNRGRRVRGRRSKRNHFRRNFNEHPGFRQLKVNSESDSDSDSHILLNTFSGLSSLTNSAEEMCPPDETVETISLTQNLPKSVSNVDENHLLVSHSENNSSDRKIKSPDLLNAEEMWDCDLHESSSSVCFPNQDHINSEGILKPADESVFEIPDDEIEKPKKELIVVEDSDDEGPEIIAITKSREEIIIEEEKPTMSGWNDTIKNSEMVHEYVNKGKEENNLKVNDVVEIPDVNESISSKDKSRRNWKSRESKMNGFSNQQKTNNQSRETSLLEKLLADDIRHERNVILQCIRHIVNNNFFGLAAKKS